MKTKNLVKYGLKMMLTVAALSLPLTALAQDKPKIKSIDLVIPVPKPGTDLFDAREVQPTSATTEYGDLAPTGDIQLMEADYIGDFVEKDSGEMLFKSGFEYKAVFKVMINPSGKYQTDYYFKNNDYGIDGSRIKITVNGKEAKVKPSAPYFIDIETRVFVGEGGAGSDREAALNMKSDYELNKDSYRRSRKAYSIDEANALSPDINPWPLIVINDSYDPRFYANDPGEFKGQNTMRVTRIIVDTDSEFIQDCVAGDVNNSIQGTYNIREIWLSQKVDVQKFIRTICNIYQGDRDFSTSIYHPYHSYLCQNKRATIFIPESEADNVMKMVSWTTWSYPILFTIKTYQGDVFSAQKAGADAAKPFCTHHVFTKKVASPDNIYKDYSCKNFTSYYYSCKYCGKCEHNPAHTFEIKYSDFDYPLHIFEQPLANDQAYIGKNSAGQHVWWYSCIWCGMSEGYEQKHFTKVAWKATGTEMNYEDFRKAMAEQAEDFETKARLTTTTQPGTFILPYKSDAKMSTAFQSSVNFALCDDLLDDEVLGKDYTVQATLIQIKSLAVRLVEELLDREIKLGKKQSGDKFVAKCAALGINEIPSPSASDSDKATRQDVAAILYKALRYVENQGVYAYTEFDNGLDKYTDKKEISPSAEEAMSFMEALGLIKGKTSTTIYPKEICSIEQAIDVAEKCTHAHQLGWYQERAWGEGIGRNISGNVYTGPDDGYSTFQTYAPGERVWVTGPRIGGMWEFLPIVDRYTGKTVYVKAEWFTPVRKHVFTSKKTVKTIEFKDYWDGVYMWKP